MDRFMPPLANGLVRFENTIELVRAGLQAEVQFLLGHCNAIQQAFFVKIYPEGLNKMTVPDLQCAFDLCLRTVAENRTKQMAETNQRKQSWTTTG
jgi:hypothetical protein